MSSAMEPATWLLCAWVMRLVQGLILVHFSAQPERFLCDKGCSGGMYGGGGWGVLAFRGCFECHKRLRLS
jgi:hypothetical protein